MSSKKSLLVSSNSKIKKKHVFMFRSDLIKDLNKLEVDAEKLGVSFPLNELIEESVAKLIKKAREELEGLKNNECQIEKNDCSYELSTFD